MGQFPVLTLMLERKIGSRIGVIVLLVEDRPRNDLPFRPLTDIGDMRASCIYLDGEE
jgi:hypothetical protein